MALIRRFRVRRRRRDNRVFRPRFDIGSMTDDELRKRYRFSLASIMFIVDLIADVVVRDTRRSVVVPPILQVLAALRFFATGGFLQLVGDSLGLSEATVSRFVWRVAVALAKLMNRFIMFSRGVASAQTQHEFYQLSRFPNIVGVIDCTHVRLQGPTRNEVDYVNRKGFHSLNVQVTCDSNFIITNCVANWPGSVHDSRIFRNSALCRNFENGTNDGLLIGDSGYPCRPFLMTPFHNPATLRETAFNTSLLRARVTVEQTFGILKRRFHCIQSGLRVSPIRAAYIVMACAVLHNIAMRRNEPLDEYFLVTDDDQAQCVPPGAHGAHGNDGNTVRQHICQHYF